MISIQKYKDLFSRFLSLETVFCIILYITSAYLLFHGYLNQFTFVIFIAGCVFVAFRFPLLTIVLLVISAVFPTVFQMVPNYYDEWMKVAFGIRIQDVIMVSMLGAVILKVFFSNRKLFLKNNVSFSVYIIIFGLWICFEILRNIKIYGLSSPGEFRYRYLILSTPLYITFFFSSTEKRKKLLMVLIACSLFFPIMCIPIIGQLKGWSIGPEARFFPASISLGLLYGLLALSIGKKYRVIKIKEILYWIIFVITGLLIIIDSHRSVWIASIAVGVALLGTKGIKFGKRMNRTVLTIFSIISILTLTNQILILKARTNFVDYITRRGSDIVKLNQKYENSASWRVEQWKSQIIHFYASPLTGEGFGGYWSLSGIPGDLGVQPHNLYVQTLVKLGGIGMILYLIIMVKIFVNFKRRLANNQFKRDPNNVTIVIGFIIIVASHVFYIAYSFEYYSLFFIGLGVASIKNRW